MCFVDTLSESGRPCKQNLFPNTNSNDGTITTYNQFTETSAIQTQLVDYAYLDSVKHTISISNQAVLPDGALGNDSNPEPPNEVTFIFPSFKNTLLYDPTVGVKLQNNCNFGGDDDEDDLFYLFFLFFLIPIILCCLIIIFLIAGRFAAGDKYAASSKA